MAPSQFRSYWQFIASFGAAAILLRGVAPRVCPRTADTVNRTQQVVFKERKVMQWEGHVYVWGLLGGMEKGLRGLGWICSTDIVYVMKLTKNKLKMV